MVNGAICLANPIQLPNGIGMGDAIKDDLVLEGAEGWAGKGEGFLSGEATGIESVLEAVVVASCEDYIEQVFFLQGLNVMS